MKKTKSKIKGSNIKNTKAMLEFIVPNQDINGYQEVWKNGRKRTYAELNIFKHWQKSEVVSPLNVRQPAKNSDIVDEIKEQTLQNPMSLSLSELDEFKTHGLTTRDQLNTKFRLPGFINGDHRRKAMDEVVMDGTIIKDQDMRLCIYDEKTWSNAQLKEAALKLNRSKNPKLSELMKYKGMFDVFQNALTPEKWQLISETGKFLRPTGLVSLFVIGEKNSKIAIGRFGSPCDAMKIWQEEYKNKYSKLSKEYINNALLLIDELSLALTPVFEKNNHCKAALLGKNKRKAYMKDKIDGEYVYGGLLQHGQMAPTFAACILRTGKFKATTNAKKCAEDVASNIGKHFFDAMKPFSKMNLAVRNAKPVNAIENVANLVMEQ